MPHPLVAFVQALSLSLLLVVVVPPVVGPAAAGTVTGAQAQQVRCLPLPDRHVTTTSAPDDRLSTARGQDGAHGRAVLTDRQPVGHPDHWYPPLRATGAEVGLHPSALVLRLLRAAAPSQQMVPGTCDGRAPPPDGPAPPSCPSAAAPWAAGPGGPACPALVGPALLV